MIEKIISGGQVGINQAILTSAFSNELKTGGFIPKGFKISDFPNFAEEYNLIEHESEDIHKSIWKNVSISEGTLRIAHQFNTEEEESRLKAIQHYDKPHIDIVAFSVNKEGYILGRKHNEIIKWIIENKIKILNIDGNSEKDFTGMHDVVFTFLNQLFYRLKQLSLSS